MSLLMTHAIYDSTLKFPKHVFQETGGSLKGV